MLPTRADGRHATSVGHRLEYVEGCFQRNEADRASWNTPPALREVLLKHMKVVVSRCTLLIADKGVEQDSLQAFCIRFSGPVRALPPRASGRRCSARNHLDNGVLQISTQWPCVSLRLRPTPRRWAVHLAATPQPELLRDTVEQQRQLPS